MNVNTSDCGTVLNADETSQAADLVRMHVLITLFEGDPDQWIAEIREVSQPGRELRADLAFLYRVKRALRSESSLARAMDDLVASVRDVLHAIGNGFN